MRRKVSSHATSTTRTGPSIALPANPGRFQLPSIGLGAQAASRSAAVSSRILRGNPSSMTNLMFEVLRR